MHAGLELLADFSTFKQLPGEDEQTPLIVEKEELASIHSHGSRSMLPLHILPPSDEVRGVCLFVAKRQNFMQCFSLFLCSFLLS